jgi:serine/threonine-protein kinase
MAIEPGTVLAGKYRIVEQLGRGGMGTVWLAEHLVLGSNVALKVIDYQAGVDDSVQRRFLQEAQAAAKLGSSNVVQIFDYGIDDGVPYIVMERLVGETLGSRLKREPVLLPEFAARIFAQIARAVQKAHDSGIVHRDLKPDNVFLVTEEEGVTAKVLDFGIAKAAPNADRAHETTATGVLLGSPLYMSPEQAHGAKVLDHRSDLWSLAVMAFECMTGRVPFRGQGWGELVAQICRDRPPVPSTVRPVPEGFDAWFARAAERDPARRFQSCRELIDALRLVLLPAAGAVRFMSSEPPPPAPADSGRASPADPTLDLQKQRRGPSPAPDAHDTIATTLRSTTGPVAASDRPSERPKRRWLAAVAISALVGIGAALMWRKQEPARAIEDAASAARPPDRHSSSAPVSMPPPTPAERTTGEPVKVEASGKVGSSATAAPPPVASSARASRTKAPALRPQGERRPTVARPSSAGGAPPATAAPAPSDVLKSRD